MKVADVTDGHSNTIFVGERPPSTDLEFGWWMAGWGQTGDGSCDVVLGSNEPYDNSSYSLATVPEYPPCVVGMTYPFQQGDVSNPCDQFHFWSYHGGGSNFLMGDGSVRFITYGVGATILPQLATRAGGEVVDGF